jgi:hypothetical protein
MPDAPGPLPQLLLSRAGVQRDGTKLSQTQYIDAVWCRFYQGLPRKILGYREQLRTVDGIARQLDVESYDGFTYVHLGTQDVLQRYTINTDSGLPGTLIDRTPTGFAADVNNNWQFSLVFDTANDANLLLAHAAPNIADISDTRERPVYFSEVRDTTAFIEIVGSDVSGGIVALWPYFLRFGNDGEVAWNVPGDITDLTGTGSGSARPWGTKIVRGLPIRGTQTSGPSAILFALDAVIIVQFVGGDTIFAFNTLTTTGALLSSNAVIENNGIYYWPTVSGWSQFNGVVRDLPNETNKQFFIDGLNFAQRQKVFAVKFPRWNEIWWCYPRGSATECSHAIIYDYGKNHWYDTPLPTVGGGWSCGMYEQIFHYPIIGSPGINAETGGTSMWQYDFGLDEISGAIATPRAIPSSFRTQEYNIYAPTQIGSTGVNRSLSFSLVEADYNQIGDLFLTAFVRANARATETTRGPFLIPADPDGNQQITKFKFTGRLTSFEILSNDLGGYYEAGSPVFYVQPSDGRMEDGVAFTDEDEV